MYLFRGLDLPAGCKQNAFEIHLDVSEIYFRCNLNVPGDPKKYSCLIKHKMNNNRGIFKIKLVLNYQ